MKMDSGDKALVIVIALFSLLIIAGVISDTLIKIYTPCANHEVEK